MKRIDSIEYCCIFFDVSLFDSSRGCYTINTFDSELGILKYYPKRKKLHLCNVNKWFSNGDKWLMKLCKKLEFKERNKQIIKSIK